MIQYILPILAGVVMGATTVIYIRSLTSHLEPKKMLRIMLWVGVPLGCLMSILAGTVIPLLIEVWRDNR